MNDIGAASICDFGLSHEHASELSTRTGTGANDNCGGTVRWMAPELLTHAAYECEGGEERSAYSTASDVWAFGMTMLEVSELTYES